MSSIQSDARFFGVDFHALWRDVCQAWAGLQDVPPFVWFTPEASVRLFQADGGESLWRGGVRVPNGVKGGNAEFNALEIPEDLLLRRALTMPAMSESDIASAALLQARAISPFAEHDLVWGYCARRQPEGHSQVELALASSKQVAQYLQEQASRLGRGGAEVWATLNQGSPIVLSGYGESAREAKSLRGRRVRYGLLALALAIVGGIAITPTLQLRARAIEAVKAHDSVVHRTPPLVKERELLMQSAEKLGALSELLAGRIEPLRVLDRLTKILPDDTALQAFTLKGQKVTLNGLTSNASAVMQILGEQSGVRDVRAPNPATRTGGANSKENFVIEFMVDPQEFGVATAQGATPIAVPPIASAAPAASAIAVAPPQAASASAAAASAPLASVPSAPVAAKTAPAAGGALVPVFGGGPAQSAPPQPKPATAKPERKETP
ncbi:PilN domain-containing protein [Acidovorax sp. BL-A-41-H1]|uniref:PilN domain-containing protein n=1 Tax=Acidovorax sp. BL-A-41-H1 TaxID=3421102 RepID=UPI003F79E3A1